MWPGLSTDLQLLLQICVNAAPPPPPAPARDNCSPFYATFDPCVVSLSSSKSRSSSAIIIIGGEGFEWYNCIHGSEAGARTPRTAPRVNEAEHFCSPFIKAQYQSTIEKGFF